MVQQSLDEEESPAEGQDASELRKVEVAAGARGNFTGLVCHETSGAGEGR